MIGWELLLEITPTKEEKSIWFGTISVSDHKSAKTAWHCKSPIGLSAGHVSFDAFGVIFVATQSSWSTYLYRSSLCTNFVTRWTGQSLTNKLTNWMVYAKMNGFETFLETFTCPSAHRVSKMCATECANTKKRILRRFSSLSTYLPGTCGWPKCVAVYINVRLAHVFVRLMFWSSAPCL